MTVHTQDGFVSFGQNVKFKGLNPSFFSLSPECIRNQIKWGIPFSKKAQLPKDSSQIIRNAYLKKDHFHAEMIQNMSGAPPDLWFAHLFGMDRIPTGLVWENSLRGRLQEKESKRRSSIKIQESPSLFIIFSLRQFGVFCTVSWEPQEAKARVSFNQLSQTPSRPSTGCPIGRGLIITVQSIKTIPVECSALAFPSKPRHWCPHLSLLRRRNRKTFLSILPKVIHPSTSKLPPSFLA